MTQNGRDGRESGTDGDHENSTLVVGNDTFRFGDRPVHISPPEERDEQRPGEIVDEVGVLHITEEGPDYWKVIQRIIDTETGIPKTRDGYYAAGDKTWNWTNGSLELPTAIRRQLDARAEGAGIKRD
ncbi:hypothetical protein ACFQDD_00660 [Halorubrum pallidum]|uniref:Uncharacterized protein n=1 Tax=Halorubrum pallidum TaxID=1526114 RepID=A0ABD5SYT7_9EURY